MRKIIRNKKQVSAARFNNKSIIHNKANGGIKTSNSISVRRKSVLGNVKTPLGKDKAYKKNRQNVSNVEESHANISNKTDISVDSKKNGLIQINYSTNSRHFHRKVRTIKISNPIQKVKSYKVNSLNYNTNNSRFYKKIRTLKVSRPIQKVKFYKDFNDYPKRPKTKYSRHKSVINKSVNLINSEIIKNQREKIKENEDLGANASVFTYEASISSKRTLDKINQIKINSKDKFYNYKKYEIKYGHSSSTNQKNNCSTYRIRSRTNSNTNNQNIKAINNKKTVSKKIYSNNKNKNINRKIKRTIHSNSKKIKTNFSAKSIKRVKSTGKLAMQTTKKIVVITKNAVKAVGKFLIGTKVGIIILIAIIAASVISAILGGSSLPFNVVLADEKIVVLYNDKTKSLQKDMNDEIDSLMNDDKYDKHTLNYMNEEIIQTDNFKEILCIMAVKFEQDLDDSKEKLDYLEYLFNLTNYFKTREVPYRCKGCVCPGHSWEDSEGNTHTEYCKPGCECEGHLEIIINVYNLGYVSILEEIGFDDDQIEWLENLLKQDLKEIYPDIDFTTNVGSSGTLTDSEIDELLQNSPHVSATRDDIVRAALSIVGRVKYFWGGKSKAGWNDMWGKPVLVTAPGDWSSGTYQPYGLDCSGYTDWVYKTAEVGNMLSGGGTAYQFNNTFGIDADELLPGDIGFMNTPNQAGVNHTGIYIGTDVNGNALFAHCAGGQGVIVNNFRFKYFRRVFVNLDD